MANVGTGDSGKTLIGNGNGQSPRYASIGTNSGLTAHGVVVAEGNSAFEVVLPGTTTYVLTSNGALTNPSFQPVSSAGAVTTITGNSGGAESPSAGNFNLLTANSTVKFVGTSATETVDFGLTNLLLGASGSSITSAVFNLGVGQLALSSLTSGSSNTCVGLASGVLLTSAVNNTLIGAGCGQAITTSGFNTACGTGSLGSSTTGSGRNTSVGFNSLNQLLTGTTNTCVGYLAGFSYTGNESNNIILGENTGTVGDSAKILIGAQATHTSCFIAGITGVTVANTNIATINSSTGQLGATTSVAVANGGTGAVTLTDHGVLIGRGTGSVEATAAGTAGQVLQSGGSSANPVYSTATYPATASTSGNVITSNGTNFVSSAPAAATKLTKYLASGSWTIDTKTVTVEFFVWSAGGGGGSGKSGVSAQSGGGGGGGGGNFVYLKSYASLLTSSPYTITVGTGGAGGGAATTANGNPGIIGGTSSVGSIIVVNGGAPGAGGTNGTANGGSSLYYNLNALIGSSTAGNGANAIGTTPTALVYGWATGGGGGSGYTAATPRIGGAGGAITGQDGTTLVAGGLAGANTGATAGNGNAPTTAQVMVGATGGGGGGCDGVSVGGTGGAGAQPGAGGGGGGGNLTANASGAGGQGGDGQVIIIEYF